MGKGDGCRCIFPLTSLQIGDLQSYLSDLSLFVATESKKFYILVDNRPWLGDFGSRSAHLWQLMVTKSRLSPFANTKARKVRTQRKDAACSGTKTAKPKKFARWFSLINSQKRVLLPVKKLRSSLLLGRELHRTLYGFIVFEVAWSSNNVRGINYINELQTDTSLAIEAKFMQRWEFDSIAQAASSLSSWFSGTISEQLQLKEHLNSAIGEVFYDAEEYPETIPVVKENISYNNLCMDEKFLHCLNSNYSVHPETSENRASLTHSPPPPTGPYKRRRITTSLSTGVEVDTYSEEMQSPGTCSSEFEDSETFTSYCEDEMQNSETYSCEDEMQHSQTYASDSEDEMQNSETYSCEDDMQNSESCTCDSEDDIPITVKTNANDSEDAVNATHFRETAIPATVDTYTSDSLDAVEATQYRDVLIVFRFNDRDLPFKLRDIIMSDLRLLTLLEAGLPSWVIFLQSYPGFCHIYRPWMCPLARTLYVLISVVTVLIGFYDLYKNVPVLKVRLFGPLFDWIETWSMVSRIKYLGTMLFLHNSQKAVQWFLTIRSTTRSFLSVLAQPLAEPLVECFGFLLPVWHLLIDVLENLFSVTWILVESSCSLVGNLVQALLFPIWFVLSAVWSVGTSIVYPIVRMLWEVMYAPVRMVLALANGIAFICACMYDTLRDVWQFISSIFQFASASQATVRTVEVSIWRSLWNDLFSQIFRAVRSILNGFVAFFIACNRHRLSIYNHIQEFIQRLLGQTQRSRHDDSRRSRRTIEARNLFDTRRKVNLE